MISRKENRLQIIAVASSYFMGLFALFTLVLSITKLIKVITVSWALVFIPLYFCVPLFIVMCISMYKMENDR